MIAVGSAMAVANPNCGRAPRDESRAASMTVRRAGRGARRNIERRGGGALALAIALRRVSHAERSEFPFDLKREVGSDGI
jgi:hypothetical protein